MIHSSWAAQIKGSGILPQTVKVTLKDGASGKALETRDLFLNGGKKLETVVSPGFLNRRANFHWWLKWHRW